MPDLINRYQSNILTIDQVETITNKSIDGDFNTLSDIADTALKKITNKAKLHDNIVYNDDAATQQLPDHSDILLEGLLDGDILRYNATTGKWYNDNLVESGTAGDITGAANVGSAGTGIYYQEVDGVLQFAKLKSNSAALVISAVSNIVEVTIADATTSAKGVVELATNGESSASLALASNDSRLTNARTPIDHSSTHEEAGLDTIKLDALGIPDDVTTLNASTTRHGLLKKLSNVATQYLDGTGNFSVPSSSEVSSYLVKNVTELTVVNSVTNTNYLQYAFAANEMGTNKVYEVVLDGIYSQGSGSSRDLLLKVTLGTTLMLDKIVGPLDDSSNPRSFRLYLLLFNKGVANAQRITGGVEVSASDDVGIGVGKTSDDENEVATGLAGSAAENTALARTFKIEMAHSAATSTTQFTRVLSYVKELK